MHTGKAVQHELFTSGDIAATEVEVYVNKGGNVQKCEPSAQLSILSDPPSAQCMFERHTETAEAQEYREAPECDKTCCVI